MNGLPLREALEVVPKEDPKQALIRATKEAIRFFGIYFPEATRKTMIDIYVSEATGKDMEGDARRIINDVINQNR